MRIEWCRNSKNEIRGIKIWPEYESKYPLAHVYYGNGATDSRSFITIEAITGMLKNPTRTCRTCIEPGAHGLTHGPVDEVGYKKTPVIRGIKIEFKHFRVDEMAEIVKREFGLDPGLPE